MAIAIGRWRVSPNAQNVRLDEAHWTLAGATRYLDTREKFSAGEERHLACDRIGYNSQFRISNVKLDEPTNAVLSFGCFKPLKNDIDHEPVHPARRHCQSNLN